ncbi:MAG TPA: ParB/RepB/Spo0J family partition protein [Coleofasciculaceae cyanobacterium]|jgi:ParB family chromosome partitioning protein
MSRRKSEKPFGSQINAPWADESKSETKAAATLVLIKEIHLPPQQPRRYFDPDALKELVNSIEQHGILQPLLVRPMTSGGYELVAGERRYRAAMSSELIEVPAVIRELSNSDALTLALIENLQREDLNPVEETEGILQLLSLHLEITVEEAISLLYRLNNESKGKVTRNVTGKETVAQVEKLFNSIGTMNWSSFVRNRLPLLKLPQDIREALQLGKIAYTKATVIARIKDDRVRNSLLLETIKNNLSLSQIKEKIEELQPNSDKPSDPLPKRLKTAYQQINKSKVWSDPKKRQKLEKLLSQLEALTSAK